MGGGGESLLKLVSRYENSHALCSWRGSLWKQTLFMSLLLMRRTKRKQVWGELLTRGEGETEFIGLVRVFAHWKLHKVTFKVKPAGHCCGSGATWGSWRGHGVHVWLLPLFSARLSLQFIQKNFINSWKHENFFFPHVWIVLNWGGPKSSKRKFGGSTVDAKLAPRKPYQKKKCPREPLSVY